MLTKHEFQQRIGRWMLMDGATGSNLRLAGMPRACSTELWVLALYSVFIVSVRMA